MSHIGRIKLLFFLPYTFCHSFTYIINLFVWPVSVIKPLVKILQAKLKTVYALCSCCIAILLSAYFESVHERKALILWTLERRKVTVNIVSFLVAASHLISTDLCYCVSFFLILCPRECTWRLVSYIMMIFILWGKLEWPSLSNTAVSHLYFPEAQWS